MPLRPISKCSAPNWRPIEILKRDMTIRLGGMMIVALGDILAGFKLIH